MPGKRAALGGLLLLAAASTLRPSHAPDEDSTSKAAMPTDAPPATVLGPLAVLDNKAETEAAAGAGATGWRTGEVLVAFTDADALAEAAAEAGAAVARISTRAGLAVLTTDQPADALLQQLREDDRVQAARRHGQTIGAGKGGKKSTSDDGGTSDPQDYTDLQWHLGAIETPSSPRKIGDVLIAVLDTGVAYENHWESSGSLDPISGGSISSSSTVVGASLGVELLDVVYSNTGDWSSGGGPSIPLSGVGYVQAQSLSGVSFFNPYDFVNGDAHANDDHQHGTHITSIIASEGAVRGVAAGAAVMPLKVLGADNTGTELDLIEALLWSADHGADVINLSLTFGEGYVPSPALLDALAYAWDSGAVLVAATGNRGGAVGFPASSPLVIGVGSVCADGSPASYSNRGPATELLAPGGCIDQDLNTDGYADGILAESIALGAPLETGLWWYAGTSQAAAVVSGAAGHLLARGLDPAEVRFVLQASAWGGGEPADGHGAGVLDLSAAASSVRKWAPAAEERFAVSMLPWLADNGDGTVSPAAMLTVLDASGASVDGLEVLGSVFGASRADFSCILEDDRCVVVGAPTALTDAGQAWELHVDAVVSDGLIHRPEPMIFASDALDAFVDWMEAAEPDRDVLMAWSWPKGSDPTLGSLAEAYSVVNTGTGIATSPFSIVVTPRAISADATVSTIADGTGIATSPFTFTRIDAGGDEPVVVAIDGTGIATSPFGAMKVHAQPEKTCTDCLLDGTPIWLGDGVLATSADVTGTALHSLMDQGGFVAASGYQGTAWVAESAEEGGLRLETAGTISP